MKPRALIACEFSGVVRDAFTAQGWDATSCDLLPSLTPGQHYQGDVRDIIGEGWDMMIAHPPCTYLSRSGWHWVNKPDCATLPLKGEPRRKAAVEAAAFFRLLLDAPIERIAIENPRPISHVNLPPHSQVIQPWQFGHGEVKATCLWLRNLPPLMATDIVPGRHPACWLASPGKDRWKQRSLTYPGIGAAMAAQWSQLLNAPTQILP
jgi:hypothetical protein